MNHENIPELLKKAINCWESIREAMVDSDIVDPKRMVPHLVIDAFLSGYRDGSTDSRDHYVKTQVTRIYGAHGADVFAEGVLSTKGDLIGTWKSRQTNKIEGSAARLGKELIRLARAGGWIDPEEDDGK